MKKLIPYAALLLLLVIITSFSREWEPQTAYSPLLIKKEDLPKSVFMQQSREFENPGKIYMYGNYIFVVDKFSGVHVIDNQDRTNPQKTGYIHISGVMDVAVRDSVLYADNAVDLVAIDLRSYPQIDVFQRVAGVFPEPLPPDLGWLPSRYSARNRPPNTVIVGWFK
jgi:hypothetical protein